MSRVVSMRMTDDESGRLERIARVLQRSLGETARLLLSEKLREEEFPFIEFRPTHSGRLAHLKGSRLAVWHVALLARRADPDQLPELLGRRREEVESALAFAEAFPEAITPFVEEADAATFEDVARLVPWAEEVWVGE